MQGRRFHASRSPSRSSDGGTGRRLGLAALLVLAVPALVHATLDPPAPPGPYDLIEVSAGAAYGINDRGWVVGTSDPFQGQAFLWKPGETATFLPAGADEALAYAVNDSGVVALYAIFDADPRARTFTWSGSGGFQPLDQAPGQTWAEAWDINDAGEVVGFTEDNSGFPVASLWIDGAWSDIGGTSAPSSSWAFGINDGGEIVGFVAEGPALACFFDGGAQPIGAGDDSSAYAVNDRGQVVGRTRLSPGNFELWLYADGDFTTIASGASVEVTDINNRGQVVGRIDQSAFIWQDGSLYDLDALVPGSPGLRVANGINDCGMIVGTTTAGSGFLLVPTVEDNTDTDGDGLADVWELCGIDAGLDGGVDLVLPGADPERKDLYVEIDAMAGHVPSPTALGLVVEAFAAAPLANPDGSTGVTLHFVGGMDPDAPAAACDPCVDEADLAPSAWSDEWGEFLVAKADRFGSPAERAHWNAAAVLEAKARVFRYGISAQSFTAISTDSSTTYSGNAEIEGNDFIVTLGAALAGRPVTDAAMAGTVMHEIGHTLGLGHGGDQFSDPFQYKPNYYSVMNYLWQMPLPTHEFGANTLADLALQQMRASWSLRYDDGALGALDENALDEAAGLGGDAFRYTLAGSIINGSGEPRLIPMGGPVDWNLDGDATDAGVAEDINYFPGLYELASLDPLTAPDDWAHLLFLPNTAPDWNDKTHPWAKNVVARDVGPAELDAAVLDALASLRFDCNANGIFDDQEIEQGLVEDANDNGIPDPCEAGGAVAVPSTQISGRGLELGAATPNPTGATTTLAFALRRATGVEVTVLDISGRVVRRLAVGARSAGTHLVRWDGRDASGRPAASGVYLLNVRTAADSASRKVVLRR